jgi:hypothetical protein
MLVKDDDRKLDSLKIKISIFILLIRYNHFNIQCTTYPSLQNKKSSPLLQATHNR